MGADPALATIYGFSDNMLLLKKGFTPLDVIEERIKAEQDPTNLHHLNQIKALLNPS